MGFDRGRKGRDICTTYPHPNCSSCGEPVVRNSWHSHSYGAGRDSRGAGVLCGECYDYILVASQPVLKALKACSLSVSSRELAGLIKADAVGVLFQAALDV